VAGQEGHLLFNRRQLLDHRKIDGMLDGLRDDQTLGERRGRMRRQRQ
jgi:hypothetical protein